MLGYLTRIVRQIIPTFLTAYLLWAIKCTTVDVAYKHFLLNDQPVIAALYGAAAIFLLGHVTLLFTYLWFLSADHSLPSASPPDLDTVFECIPPPSNVHAIHSKQKDLDEHIIVRSHDHDAITQLVQRCETCDGAPKPGRVRHCRTCGKCRTAYDHHCPTLATCLTAPYLPAFLAILILGTLATFLLAAPLYTHLWYHGVKAWDMSRSDGMRSQPLLWPDLPRWWPDSQPWWPDSLSWPDSPLHLWTAQSISFIQAWDGVPSFEVAGMFLLAHILAGIAIFLLYSLVSNIRVGDFTIDMWRAATYDKALDAAAMSYALGEDMSDKTAAALARFSPKLWFFVPTPTPTHSTRSARSFGEGVLGVVLPILDGERPYDLGPASNWDNLVADGRGWFWVLPWNAIEPLNQDRSVVINPAVKARLEETAREVLVLDKDHNGSNCANVTPGRKTKAQSQRDALGVKRENGLDHDHEQPAGPRRSSRRIASRSDDSGSDYKPTAAASRIPVNTALKKQRSSSALNATAAMATRSATRSASDTSTRGRATRPTPQP